MPERQTAQGNPPPEDLPFHPNATIHDVLKQIQVCVEEDHEIEKELEGLLAERETLESQIDRIMYPAEAHSLKQNMGSLTNKIRDTAVTAYSLSSKVRRLDVAQARLEEAIHRVDTIVNLKTTIDKVNAMIEKRQYDQAAKLTHGVLHSRDSKALPNDSSFEVIADLERKLFKLVVKECDRAAVKASEAAKRKIRSAASSSSGSDDTSTKSDPFGLQDSKDGESGATTKAEQVSPEFRKVFDLCLILALLDKKHQGLGRYCFAARTMLVLGSKKLQIGSNPGSVKYPDRLSEMLDAIAFCIQLHMDPLRERFGPGSELRLIQELVEECDSKIHQLVKQFIDTKKIGKIVKGVQKLRHARHTNRRRGGGGVGGGGDSKNSQTQDKGGGNNKGLGGHSGGGASGGASGGGSGGYEPKMLDGLLEEIAYILREIQIFDYNIRQRGDAARKELKEAQSQQALWKAMCEDRLKDSLPRTTKVNQLQQELSGHYIVIEEYFMNQDVQTAIELDDNSDNAQTTSMVDDVFYILKKCSERAFSTCDMNSACAIVNLLNSMLQTLYKDQLSSKLAVCWEKTQHLTQLLFAQDQGNQEKVESSIITALNNIQVSAAHIGTLKNHLMAHTMDVFEHVPAAIKMATHCLDGLGDTRDSYMRIVHQYIAKFVKDQVSKVSGPKALGTLLERFGQQNYELKEGDYLTREANDSYIPTLLLALESQHKAMNGRLTQSNLELMLSALANHIVNSIETYAMRKRFTFWGGLQFDKDVRKISSLFNKLSTKPIRDKFSRLLQIASLLQVDKVEEILDYWTSDAQVWRLSPMDVKAVLGLRVEFSKAAINKIQL